MLVFDCDDRGQFEALANGGLDVPIGDNGLQGFAPDTLTEAQNRGFRVFRKNTQL
jgi:hypothetical protein